MGSNKITMSESLNLFRVRLALLGALEVDVNANIRDMRQEFEERSYLHNPKVWWDKQERKLIAEFTIGALNSKWAENEAYEAFSDVIYGNITSSKEDIVYHIDTLSVETTTLN